MTPRPVWLGKVDQPLGIRKRQANAGTPGTHHALPGRASLPWPDASHLTIRCWDINGFYVGIAAKREVEVCVKSKSIGIGQQTGPNGEAADTVGNCDVWTFSFTNARNSTDHPVNFQVAGKCASTESNNNCKNGDAQGCQGIPPNRPRQGLVDDTKHGNDVNVLRLADELREDSDVIEHSLGVRVSHGAIQKVEGALFSRVIEGCKWTQSGF